jgi:transcriptional regulator with XRE-family HTH domain
MAMKVRELGSFIREQRKGASISLRKLAKTAGVSNPYLSQIERGLRRPSAEILQAIAKALQISAETLYVQAGILDDREGTDVRQAVLADRTMTKKQKDVLLGVYESFRTAGQEAEILVERVEAAATIEPAELSKASPRTSTKASPRKKASAKPRKSAPAASAKAKAG